MIDQELDKYFISKKKLGMEHRDSIYATSASCDKMIDKGSNFTKVYGACMRQAYYSCIGAGESSVDKLRDMSRRLGDYTEYMLLKIFESNGTLKDKAVKFTIDQYNISGKLDGILEIDGEKAGLEIKSISANQWTVNSIFGSRWNKSAPKIEHLLQCLIYLYAYKGEIDVFYLVYIRRDNGDVKEFKLELALVDGILYPSIDGVIDYSISCNNILERMNRLKIYIDSNIIPPRDYYHVYTKQYVELLLKYKLVSKSRYDKFLDFPFGDHQCLGCGYRDLCIKDGDSR